MTATSAFAVFEPARTSFCKRSCVLQRGKIRQDQLGVDHLNIPDGIDRSLT